MDDAPVVSESRDGQGAGDRDTAYAWGNAPSFLTLRQQARLTVLRGLVKDVQHGEHGGPAEGDLSWTEELPSGVAVPMVGWRGSTS